MADATLGDLKKNHDLALQSIAHKYTASYTKKAAATDVEAIVAG